jgi:transcriptional regulator with XRE-family HTH domain
MWGDKEMYAEKLKQAITDSKKTLDQISDDCKNMGVEVTPSYISKLQNGYRKPPREKVSVAIARSLGIDPMELLECAMQEKIESMKNMVKKITLA